MLSASMVAEIRGLLDEGRLSRRAIARQLGVSRGSVDSIASGRRTERDGEPNEKSLQCKKRAPARRCRECGGMVNLPCLLCRARAYRRRQEVARLVAVVKASRRQVLRRNSSRAKSLCAPREGSTLEAANRSCTPVENGHVNE